MKIGRIIAVPIAIHAALIKTHGVDNAIQDTAPLVTHAALKTTVHGVGAAYLTKTSQSGQTLSDTEIPAAIARDTEVATAVSDEATARAEAITTHAEDAAIHHTQTPPDTTTLYASANLRNSNDAVKGTTSVPYVKLKEVLLNADLPGCTIKFDIKNGGIGDVKAKVYKNGVAIGVEQSNGTDTWATKSEDFSGFSSGDLIQIYVHHSHGTATAGVSTMRFYYDETITHLGGKDLTTNIPTDEDPTISMTNQDP